LECGAGEGWRSWTDCVRNGVKEERNIIHMCTIKRRKANWIGHILHRNCPLKTCYWRKDWGKDRNDGKTGKKKM
jgi:hypothetical protein